MAARRFAFLLALLIGVTIGAVGSGCSIVTLSILVGL
jgi:tetrahydromethanopterin S-methyltransferase subunit E